MPRHVTIRYYRNKKQALKPTFPLRSDSTGAFSRQNLKHLDHFFRIAAARIHYFHLIAQNSKDTGEIFRTSLKDFTALTLIRSHTKYPHNLYRGSQRLRTDITCIKNIPDLDSG